MTTMMLNVPVAQVLRNLEFIDHYDSRTASRDLMYWTMGKLNEGKGESVAELFQVIDVTKFSCQFLVALIRCTLNKGVPEWDAKFKATRLYLMSKGYNVDKLFIGIKY